MRAAKKERSLRRPKLAVVSHLFKMNQLKVNFGLLRDPSFLAARMGAVTYRFVFELFSNLPSVDSL